MDFQVCRPQKYRVLYHLNLPFNYGVKIFCEQVETPPVIKFEFQAEIPLLIKLKEWNCSCESNNDG